MTADVVSVPVIGACAAPDEVPLLYLPHLPLCIHTRRYHCYATWELDIISSGGPRCASGSSGIMASGWLQGACSLSGVVWPESAAYTVETYGVHSINLTRSASVPGGWKLRVLVHA